MMTNILFLLAGIIGLIVVIIILKHQKHNKIMNLFFVMFLVLSSCRQLYIGIQYFVTDNNYGYIYSNYEILAIPLLYLYFKNIENTKKANKKELLLIILFSITFSLLKVNKIDFQYIIKPINVDLFLYIISFLYSIWYIYLSYEILSKNIWIWNENKMKGNTNSLVINWTKFLYISISLLPIKIILSFLLEVYNISINFEIFQHFTSTIILIIVFKLLNNPEILYGYEALNEEIKLDLRFNVELFKNWIKTNENVEFNSKHKIIYDKINLKVPKYIKKIEQMSLNEEFFLRSDLDLNYLANRLKIPKSHLICLFKYYSKLSFTDFKKKIRIYHATILIQKHYLKHNTLNTLSKKVGFSSYDPFYRSFKEFTGYSPLEYYNLLQPTMQNFTKFKKNNSL